MDFVYKVVDEGNEYLVVGDSKMMESVMQSGEYPDWWITLMKWMKQEDAYGWIN